MYGDDIGGERGGPRSCREGEMNETALDPELHGLDERRSCAFFNLFQNTPSVPEPARDTHRAAVLGGVDYV